MAAFQDLTPHKRLRTGRSLWSDVPHPKMSSRRLHTSLKCDVAIIGAGISGAFMAEALTRQYDNVVVMDRRAPSAGSTHASTAMLQYEIDTPLTKLADRIGFADASRAWHVSKRTTARLIRLIGKEEISCDLEERNSLYLAGPSLGWRGMAQEARARQRAGLKCEFLSSRELKARFDIARTGAIWSPGAAVANPVALTLALLQKAKGRGSRVFAPCEVKGVLANRSGVVLDAGSHFIEARHAIFCSGYEVVRGLPKAGTEITSSWAAATAPHAALPGWLARTLVWEAADPYLYMRTDPAGRLMVGGEDARLDSPVYRARTLTQKAERLAQKSRSLLRGFKPEWTHVWAGAFGESDDGLPIIDAVPGLPGCFVVMGFGGNGTIYSALAAELMPGLLKGKPANSASLFRFR